jgi:hypothetical protein
LTSVFHGIFQSVHRNSRLVLQHKPHLLHFTSFPIYFSVVILSVDIIHCELLMTASQYCLLCAWWMTVHFGMKRQLFIAWSHIIASLVLMNCYLNVHFHNFCWFMCRIKFWYVVSVANFNF